MVFFNYALRKLNAKIVYYGPGLCGKTTNLVWIHDHFEGGDRGKMISLATEGDRTIFFDLLPLDIGSIRGMDVTLQLYTVPGQVHYNSTRQLVLRGADGVVFVADSQRAMQSSNIDSFKNLQENLLLQGISLDGFPHVLQFNKRDLRDVVPVEELNDDLNHYSVPIFEATATQGVGVQETLEGIVKLVMRNLRQRYEGATTGARTPGVEDSQVRIPEAPPTPPPGPKEVPPPAARAKPISVPETPPPVKPVTPPAARPPAKRAPPPERKEPAKPVEPLKAPPPVAPIEPPEPTPPVVVPPFMPDDPAKTVDFSQSMGADPFGGLGGGFEDEVSTAVYDVEDDSAIDFEELKRLDAEPRAPTPPPMEPPDRSYEASYEDAEPLEAPEEAPPAFDLESTDAGVKTQDAAAAETYDDSMAAFEIPSTPPDLDSIPDFELDEPTPVPRRFAPPKARPETAAPPPVPEPPSFAEPPAAEEAPFAASASPPPIAGRYEDRIEAPSPFAPNPQVPGRSADIIDALSATADREPAAVPPEPEEPPFAVDESFEEPEIIAFEDDFGAPEVAAAEDDYEAAEVARAEDDFEAEVAAEVVGEIEPPPIGDDADLFEAPPLEPLQPVVVGNDDPWTEEELSGVYDLAEVEKAERAAAIEAATPRPIDVRAEDNQLHLRLQGTGAIVEGGQVRAIDIEVPVPGAWVGNRRVTLQLRLTLTPDTEDEDGGSGSPS